MIAPVYIVQCLDTFEFLCPNEDSLVGFTSYLLEAGIFYERESALESAIEEIGEHFYIFEFLKEIND